MNRCSGVASLWRQNSSQSPSLPSYAARKFPGSRLCPGFLPLSLHPPENWYISPLALALNSYSSHTLSLKSSKGRNFSPFLSDSAAKNPPLFLLTPLHFSFQSVEESVPFLVQTRKMGFSKKSQAEGGVESEAKKWVVAGISIRAALKPISTKPRLKVRETGEVGATVEEEEEGLSRPSTPTGREARIPEILPCPAAPRKRRSRPSRCRVSGSRQFFTPPDLESVFKLGQC